jgi:hypothetical protein
MLQFCATPTLDLSGCSIVDRQLEHLLQLRHVVVEHTIQAATLAIDQVRTDP